MFKMGPLKSIGRKITPESVRKVPEWIKNHRPKITAQEEIHDRISPNQFRGQVVLFVGACGALGEETSRQFILHGAERIILAGDNEDALVSLSARLTHNINILRVNPQCQIGWLLLDLSVPHGLATFLNNFDENVPHVHTIIFNAALFLPYFQAISATNRFVEKMLQVNCYSQCLLLMGLRDQLRRSAVARGEHGHVVFVTCDWQANEYGRTLPGEPDELRDWLIDREHFESEKHFHLSKLLTTFFVYYYCTLLPVSAGQTVVNTVYPGTLRKSRLYRHFSRRTRRAVQEGRSLLGRSNSQAARVLLAAAKSHSSYHGACILGNDQVYRTRSLVTQHARLKCAWLVYRHICDVMTTQVSNMGFPYDENYDEPIGMHPWG